MVFAIVVYNYYPPTKAKASETCDYVTTAEDLLTLTTDYYAAASLSLKHFITFNSIVTAEVLDFVCELRNNSDTNSEGKVLSDGVTGKYTSGDYTITYTDLVTNPDEADDITTEYEYTKKMVVMNDTATILTMSWSGSGTASSGYLIFSEQPTSGVFTGKYIHWSRDANDQFVKVFEAGYKTSYLGTATAVPDGAAGMGITGDYALYADMSYNAKTKAFDVQTTYLGTQSGAGDGDEIGCFRFNGTGNLWQGDASTSRAADEDRTFTLAKTESDVWGDGGHASTFDRKTMTDGLDQMDAAVFDMHVIGSAVEGVNNELPGGSPDSDGIGIDNYLNYLSGNIEPLEIPVFTMSCNDVSTANTSDGAFSAIGNGGVDHTLAPDEVFAAASSE